MARTRISPAPSLPVIDDATLINEPHNCFVAVRGEGANMFAPPFEHVRTTLIEDGRQLLGPRLFFSHCRDWETLIGSRG